MKPGGSKDVAAKGDMTNIPLDWVSFRPRSTVRKQKWTW